MRSTNRNKSFAANTRRAAAVAACAIATSLLGTGSAFAQSGGVGAPGGTTTDPATPTPAPAAAAGSMIFPVAGPHSFGQGVGAPRGGRSHQGQDILAGCGLPAVAVSQAKVKYVSYQGAAGNYVVLRNKALHQDYMYAHLVTPSPLVKGQIVQPGQQVGVIGRTGNATACMLHFEVWLGKWFRGGRATDPMPYLRTYQGY